MKLSLALAAACLLAVSPALFAQGTPGPRQERHEKMKAAHQKARQACEGQKDQAHRDCMRKEMCAQSKDPQRCEEHFKERSAAFNKAYDACKGSASGDAFRDCMRKQRMQEKK